MFHQLRPPQDVNEQPQKDPVFKVRLALAVAQYCCRMAACVKLAVGIESFLRSLTTTRRFLTAEAGLKAMHRSSTYRYISHTLSYSPIAYISILAWKLASRSADEHRQSTESPGAASCGHDLQRPAPTCKSAGRRHSNQKAKQRSDQPSGCQPPAVTRCHGTEGRPRAL